jgi:hypothetical protein
MLNIFDLLSGSRGPHIILDIFTWLCLVCEHILRETIQSAATVIFVIIISSFIYLEAAIMSFKPDQKLEIDEIKFFSELGWFATISVVVASFAPLIADVFG